MIFDKLRKAFSRGTGEEAAASGTASAADPGANGPVSEWAATQGLTFSGRTGGAMFSLRGDVGGRTWRMEVGRPSRKYVEGDELRGRAELGVDPDVAVLLMNRPLKAMLEKQAYSLYTDGLQTSVNSSLPEEMRWLAVYEEVGWESAPRLFWERYSVLADHRQHALAWLDSALIRQMLEWPEPAPAASVPFMLMLLRGKAYLRMQHDPRQTATLHHATQIFTSACESALGSFKA
ncbi:MAG: hypothetical protein NVS2B4_00630 [Ramlibacter sp.]